MESIVSFFFDTKNFISDNAAILIALLALTISLIELTLQRKHNKLSVRPEIGGKTNIFENELTVYQKNIGLGPAKIIEFKLLVNNKEIEGNLTEYWDKFLKDFKIPADNIHHEEIKPPCIMQVNEEFIIVSINALPPHKYSSNDQQKFREAIKTLSLKITFESMYKEKFRYDISFIK